MQRTARTATPPLILALFATMTLSGCASATNPDRDGSDDKSSPREAPCIVGTWNLDVSDYEAQSADFVNDRGLPIADFALDGAGTIQFTSDGLVSTDIDLTTTGTIVAGDTRVPLNTPSAYTATGNWSTGSDPASLDLKNWATVPGGGSEAASETSTIPAIDYTDIPTVTANCSAEELVLQAPGAPLSARWTRGGEHKG